MHLRSFFFFVLEETRVSLGAFVFLRQALSFFKIAIFRFPDYISTLRVLSPLPIHPSMLSSPHPYHLLGLLADKFDPFLVR